MNVGDKVVCVDFRNCTCGCNGIAPWTKEQVWVVSATRVQYGKLLLQFINGVYMGNHDSTQASRFRKLDDMKKDAEIRNKGAADVMKAFLGL